MLRKTLLIISTTLAVATLVLGIASYWKNADWMTGDVSMMGGQQNVFAALSEGRIILVFEKRVEQFLTSQQTDSGSSCYWSDTANEERWPLGVLYASSFMNWFEPPVFTRFKSLRFSVPLWIPLVLTSAYPGVALVRNSLRGDRRRRDLCVKCGYDLIGNASGTCPECGKPTPEERHGGKTGGSRREQPG